MKKITSFLIAGLLVLVASASARQARVVLNSNTNYEVQIDGRTYNSAGTSTINDLNAGRHSVAVYRVISRGIFGIGRKRNQLSFEQFTLRNNDVHIAINKNGHVRISQDDYNGNNRNRNRNGDYGKDHDGNDRYGKSEGKGRGHKYGHNKNKKDKNYKGNHKHHDDDDDYRKDRRGDRD